MSLVVSFIAKFFDERKVLPGFGKEQRPISHSGILAAKRSKNFDRKLSSF